MRSAGYNPSSTSEYNQAMAIFQDEKLVTSSGDYTCFICQMHKSISGTEMSTCCAGNSAAYELFLQ